MQFSSLQPRSFAMWNHVKFLLLAASVVVLSSCSERKEPLYPVSGTLHVGGQPAENALLIFHPQPDTQDDVVRPTARVAADGSFKLTTFQADDGAPAGRYVVTVEWRSPPTNPFDAGGPDKLQGRYNDRRTSQLSIEVGSEPTQLEPIELAGPAGGGGS